MRKLRGFDQTYDRTVEHGLYKFLNTKAVFNKSAGADPKENYDKEKAPLIELYAERYEKGLDIWTGEPLNNSELAQWAENISGKSRGKT